jgi:hypothetical protein
MDLEDSSAEMNSVKAPYSWAGITVEHWCIAFHYQAFVFPPIASFPTD